MKDSLLRAWWAHRQGLKIFHIGGGTSSRPDDPLLHFKMGFSSRVHEFAVWRWVLNPAVYEELCDAKSQWNERNGLRMTSAGFFPRYRAPAVPTAGVCAGDGSQESAAVAAGVSS